MTLLSSPNAFIYMYVQYKSFLYTTLSYHLEQPNILLTVLSLIEKSIPLLLFPLNNPKKRLPALYLYITTNSC